MRLINMGLERYMVSYAVCGAVAQRLVPKLCETCRMPYKVNPQSLLKLCEQCGIPPETFLANKKPAVEGEVQYINAEGGAAAFQDLVFYKNIGCDHCRGTGYLGRMGIFEVVFFNDELRDAIVRNLPMAELEKIAIRSGFKPLALDAIEKVKAGVVALDDIFPILLEKSAT
ncbi:MAG: hypothetical protein HQL16_08215 [Candidatus Omnitrophica bacterium]|nr:hypothetical protein [Candidatus Omnitrophota bacterium]